MLKEYGKGIGEFLGVKVYHSPTMVYIKCEINVE